MRQLRADTDQSRKFECPDKYGELAADGTPRQEWEVALLSDEVLFVPEGWELSTMRAVGVTGAGTQVVATVPFGWEDWRRECC